MKIPDMLVNIFIYQAQEYACGRISFPRFKNCNRMTFGLPKNNFLQIVDGLICAYAWYNHELFHQMPSLSDLYFCS